jgi:hypothetical protein
MITSGKIYATENKYCGNCRYVREWTVSDGKGTHTFSCSRIRGAKQDEYGDYIEDEMKVRKYGKACNFYKKEQ